MHMSALKIREILLFLAILDSCRSISSPILPFTSHPYSIELEKNNADLWWSINNSKNEIIFELHVKTTGWTALGISPAGGMKGADIAVTWVDSQGKVYIQDTIAFGTMRPVVDNTTQDWTIIKGQEENGWTATQFKRSFDSCDPMDVSIKSGTNILIFAYGLVDPDPSKLGLDITYHQSRRGTRILPLRSYTVQPAENIFNGYDVFDLRFDNLIVPSTDTTYYCKVFKSPDIYDTKRHAIAHKVFIDERNLNLVHHLDLYECNGGTVFQDSALPDGVCDDIVDEIKSCSSSMATAWAVGADPITTYPLEAGYAVTGNTGPKYFMIKMHYNNPELISNQRDSSGIRFYLGHELRKYDLGYFITGTLSSPSGLAIPPRSNRFIVDSFCPPEATQKVPTSGITVVSALPHTHLQGSSVWTKLIRNSSAVQYLFNAESYDFNYQFENRLVDPIKIYPGDAFATRCIYNTMNKNTMTLGGPRTADEMCLHIFAYYPLIDSLAGCMTANDEKAWQSILKHPEPLQTKELAVELMNLTWTSESVAQWQQFYNDASRLVIFGGNVDYKFEVIARPPNYKDLAEDTCDKPNPEI